MKEPDFEYLFLVESLVRHLESERKGLKSEACKEMQSVKTAAVG